MALKVCVFIAAVNAVGVQTTSFIALLGSAGLAVGLALQGSLSNFAGGVLILLLKPFKVGDVIKAAGHVGSVDKITTFSTTLRTPDNQIITIPNGGLANSSQLLTLTVKIRDELISSLVLATAIISQKQKAYLKKL